MRGGSASNPVFMKPPKIACCVWGDALGDSSDVMALLTGAGRPRGVCLVGSSGRCGAELGDLHKRGVDLGEAAV
jgi:hypothetical protein